MEELPFGVLYRCANPPEDLPAFAREVERLGYRELWVAEDCFFGGGIATAAVAAAATTRLRVAIGILPAVLRNPALAAMEVATLCRVFPGRIRLGIGHGVPAWMRQVGAYPAAPLDALAETVRCVRDLLHGRTVTVDGGRLRLDAVRLDHPPTSPPAVLVGGRRARTLRLSGEIADGTVIAELASPSHLRWMRRRIDEGRSAAGRSDPHHVTAYTYLDLGGADRADLRREVAAGLWRAEVIRTDDEELDAEVAALVRSASGVDALAAALPEPFVAQLGVAGRPAEVPAAVRRLTGAGVDTVVFIPPDRPDEARRQLALAAEALRSAP